MPSNSIAFDRAVEFYDQTRGFPVGIEQEAAQLFVRVGKLTLQSRVLEIGIGTGRIALPLAPFVGIYSGVDISRPMMHKLRAKQRDERIELAEADATLLPFPDATFDAVVGVHIFHLIAEWRAALREVSRVLKPDGVLLHGWNRSDDNTKLQEFWRQKDQSQSGTSITGGLSMGQRKTFLSDEGWRLLVEGSYAYSTSQAPSDHIDQIRRRLWSRCWQLTDEELEAQASQLEAFIAANFDDPTQPVAVEAAFHVQSYAVPALDDAKTD